MAWQTPKTNWTSDDSVTNIDLNRIEGNTVELKKASNIDIVDSGGNYAASNVEDALQEAANNVKSGKSTIAGAITSMGQSASGTDTFGTLANKIKAISTDANAGVGDVLTGKTFYQGGVKRTGTMANRGAPTFTPGPTAISIPSGFYSGGTIKAASVAIKDSQTSLSAEREAGDVRINPLPNNGDVFSLTRTVSLSTSGLIVAVASSYIWSSPSIHNDVTFNVEFFIDGTLVWSVTNQTVDDNGDANAYVALGSKVVAAGTKTLELRVTRTNSSNGGLSVGFCSIGTFALGV